MIKRISIIFILFCTLPRTLSTVRSRWLSAPINPSSQPTALPSMQPTSQPTVQPIALPSGLPTTKPSKQPTVQPAARPSCRPSMQPSTRPSGQPVARPSTRPSTKPTTQPSSQPSCQPIDRPTVQPSTQPTEHPSGQPVARPSSQPSSQPSAQPSSLPSIQPSTQPTAQPVDRPSSQPTSQPFGSPTGQPTIQPSSRPSKCPSLKPSAQPSTRPSVQPSSQPSTQPSMTPSRQPVAAPSCKPSAQPSDQPSSQPTFYPTSPTSQPSKAPSSQPSNQPSSRPTCQPTNQPTGHPTVQPTSQPSHCPSSQPSSQPRGCPTSQPTRQPSNLPTSWPSRQPISRPSALPSLQPFGKPSSKPSGQSSNSPSGKPSRQPAGSPSRIPSRAPSSNPSRQPWGIPSSRPSSQPLRRPSSRPSRQPYSRPSCRPSRQPSNEPSTQPSSKTTMQPPLFSSSKPSMQPSARPSRQPISRPSSQPSQQPVVQPTCRPSRQPTKAPSKQPLSRPTAQPSRQPSGRPSLQPSRRPTGTPTTTIQTGVMLTGQLQFAGANITIAVFTSKALTATRKALQMYLPQVNPQNVQITGVSSSVMQQARERRLQVSSNAVQVGWTASYVAQKLGYQNVSSSIVTLRAQVQTAVSSGIFASTIQTVSGNLFPDFTVTSLPIVVATVMQRSGPRPSSQPSQQPTATPTANLQTEVILTGELIFSGTLLTIANFTTQGGLAATVRSLSTYLPLINPSSIKINTVTAVIRGLRSRKLDGAAGIVKVSWTANYVAQRLGFSNVSLSVNFFKSKLQTAVSLGNFAKTFQSESNNAFPACCGIVIPAPIGVSLIVIRGMLPSPSPSLSSLTRIPTVAPSAGVAVGIMPVASSNNSSALSVELIGLISLAVVVSTVCFGGVVWFILAKRKRAQEKRMVGLTRDRSPPHFRGSSPVPAADVGEKVTDERLDFARLYANAIDPSGSALSSATHRNAKQPVALPEIHTSVEPPHTQQTSELRLPSPKRSPDHWLPAGEDMPSVIKYPSHSRAAMHSLNSHQQGRPNPLAQRKLLNSPQNRNNGSDYQDEFISRASDSQDLPTLVTGPQINSLADRPQVPVDRQQPQMWAVPATNVRTVPVVSNSSPQWTVPPLAERHWSQQQQQHQQQAILPPLPPAPRSAYLEQVASYYNERRSPSPEVNRNSTQFSRFSGRQPSPSLTRSVSFAENAESSFLPRDVGIPSNLVEERLSSVQRPPVQPNIIRVYVDQHGRPLQFYDDQGRPYDPTEVNANNSPYPSQMPSHPEHQNSRQPHQYQYQQQSDARQMDTLRSPQLPDVPPRRFPLEVSRQSSPGRPRSTSISSSVTPNPQQPAPVPVSGDLLHSMLTQDQQFVNQARVEADAWRRPPSPSSFQEAAAENPRYIRPPTAPPPNDRWQTSQYAVNRPTQSLDSNAGNVQRNLYFSEQRTSYGRWQQSPGTFNQGPNNRSASPSSSRSFR